MSQVAEDDTTDLVRLSRVEDVIDTRVVNDSDSPLARAMRRRRHELDHPIPVAAGHDSRI